MNENKRMWTTEIKAISPLDETIHIYYGPQVPGDTLEDAQKYCNQNGLGYCKVNQTPISMIIIPGENGKPDRDKSVLYDEKYRESFEAIFNIWQLG